MITKNKIEFIWGSIFSNDDDGSLLLGISATNGSYMPNDYPIVAIQIGIIILKLTIVIK
jgi:hypothetical protein